MNKESRDNKHKKTNKDLDILNNIIPKHIIDRINEKDIDKLKDMLNVCGCDCD